LPMKAKIEKLMVFLIPTDQVVGDFSQSMIKSDKLLGGEMPELIAFGPVPTRILRKARKVLKSDQLRQGEGWKKIHRICGWYSYRLSIKYRLLRTFDGPSYVCKHEIYEKQIRRMNA